MSILIDNKEIGKFSNSNSNVNVLSYKDIVEVHDNIYLITTHNNQTFLKECKGKWKSNPVVEFNIHTGNKLFKNVEFVLDKKQKSAINYERYGVVAKKVIKEDVITTPQQVATPPSTKTPSLSNAIAAGVSEDKVKEYVEQTILKYLTDQEPKEQFAKFFDVYTEAFKRDIVKQTEKISRREMLRAMESGGGTNAVNFSNGGTIQGDLTVTGSVIVSSLTSTGDTRVGTLTSDGDIKAGSLYSEGGEIQGSNFIGDLFIGKMRLSSIEGDGAVLSQSIKWDGFNWTATTTKAVHQLGDGVNSSFTITHGFSSLDVIHQVYDNTTNEVVLPYIQNTDVNNTQVTFAFVPALTAYRIVTLT